MSRFVVKAFGLAIVYMMTGLIIVSNADVPYNFSPGTPAKSSEVNANFEHVNYGNLVVKDGNGNEIGTSLGGGILIMLPSLAVLNEKGFIFEIDPITGKINWRSLTFFTTDDCTGTPYSFGFSGYVSMKNDGLYYIQKNAIAYELEFKSSMAPPIDQCIKDTQKTILFPLTPNTPSITGVSSSSFPTPITIDRR